LLEPALENETVRGEYPLVGVVADAAATAPLNRIRRTSPVVNER